MGWFPFSGPPSLSTWHILHISEFSFDVLKKMVFSIPGSVDTPWALWQVAQSIFPSSSSGKVSGIFIFSEGTMPT